MRAFTFLASRFVAGDEIEDAIDAVSALNARGIKATLDFLGEDCSRESQAHAATDEYLNLLDAIARSGLDCNVSLKLTQLGLNLNPGLAKRNLAKVVEKAGALKNFVRIDMEGSKYTEATLDIFFDAYARNKNVGPVIQAYLFRSERDIERLIDAGARVRLCKGAYKEAEDIAIQEAAKVGENYDALARALMERGNYPGLATHDEDRVQNALDFAAEKGISKDRFEFQMLYGLRPARWDQLVAGGYNMRVYVPYGTHWFPYFTRRLRERKENWMFVLRSLVRG